MDGFAKVVIVKVDDRRLVIAVIPANCRVDLDELGRLCDTNQIRLATEEEFKDAFPECELGAMPPFGNIYHLDVWFDGRLRFRRWLRMKNNSH